MDSIAALKKELMARPAGEVLHVCVGLAKLRPENKEMLAYLLFEAHDPLAYAEVVKRQMDELLDAMPRTHYQAVKVMRKTLQLVTKYNRFTKSRPGEVELLLHFGRRYRELVSPDNRFPALQGLGFRPLKKARTLIAKLPDDLQYDYTQEYNAQVYALLAAMRHWDRTRFPLAPL